MLIYIWAPIDRYAGMELETLNQWPVSTDIMVGCLWGSTFPPYLGLQLVKGSTNLLRGHNQLFCWVWLSQVSPKPLPNHKLLTLNPALHPVGPQTHEDYCVLWGPSQDFLVHFLNFLKLPKPYLVSTLPCHISFGWKHGRSFVVICKVCRHATLPIGILHGSFRK